MASLTIADVIVPDTAAAAKALEVASEHHCAAMLNHSQRVYLWAAADGLTRGIDFDPELLFVASMFHDFGLVAVFDSHTVAFEHAGGQVASVFAAGAGWRKAHRERLAEVIVAHMQPDVDAAADPEGLLIARATAADVVGRGLEAWDPSLQAEVLDRHPRLDLTTELTSCFEDQAARKPESRAGAVVRGGLRANMSRNPLDHC